MATGVACFRHTPTLNAISWDFPALSPLHPLGQLGGEAWPRSCRSSAGPKATGCKEVVTLTHSPAASLALPGKE